MLFSLDPLQSFKTFGDVESEINEDTIRVRLNLISLEKDVGLEVEKRLIDDVHVVAIGRPVRLTICVSIEQSIARKADRSPEFGLKGQESQVSDRLIGDQLRMVGRHRVRQQRHWWPICS